MTDSWITLRTFETQPLAELARVALLNAGIPCRILNAEVVSMDWLLANAVGYIPLQVPEDQFEAADQALGGDSSAGEMPLGDCPKCGEPLNNDGRCPMCGHDVESAAEGRNPAEARSASDENSAKESDSPPMLLDNLRALGRSAISAYLGFVLIYFVVAALALFSMLSTPFR